MTEETILQEPAGAQMSFLEHLDELRKRIIRSVIALVIAFLVCFYFSEPIYNFLSAPIRRALNEAARQNIPVAGINGDEAIRSVATMAEGDTGRYMFDSAANLGSAVIAAGTTVNAKVARDSAGNLGLFTTEPLFTNSAIIPAGVRLPVPFNETAISQPSADERMTVTTAMEPYMIYVTVSFYAAIAFALPFFLWQIWMFVSPALYEHERRYVTPFVGLSSISFIGGVAFAYYLLFPPAAAYLLGVGHDFKLLLKANDYLDFITIVLLAMGVIFQMPAITYVLARIGIINARLMIRTWKVSLIVILIVAAVVSPTNDIPNMMLFAAPMIVLYVVSIFIAWFFGKKRKTDAEAGAGT
ncbi:MAG: twin-arginine translocase subunit TatC [Acidobacteria bacterium]|nr:twin-arginine translocase subunit TatC [Acidobacteriota bacterium]